LDLPNYFSPFAVSPVAANLAVCLLVALVASTGCEKRVEGANIDVVNRQQKVAQKRPSAVENVQEGLTMKEVEAVLGAPAGVKTGKLTLPVQKDFVLTTWVYRQDGQDVELSFIDGKLQGSVPRFGETPESTAPLKMRDGKSNGPEGR
jgi:hypothetical protein